MREFFIQTNQGEDRWTEYNPWSIVDAYGHVYKNVRKDEDPDKALQKVSWEENLPVGVRTSSSLIEARTVLSRAQTALSGLLYAGRNHTDDGNVYYGTVPEIPDPERRAIAEDLLAVVIRMGKWGRTGPKPKYKESK